MLHISIRSLLRLFFSGSISLSLRASTLHLPVTKTAQEDAEVSPSLMGQREFWCFSLLMLALLLNAVFLLPSLNPLIRPFALAACDGFIRRYYEEGLSFLCSHPDGHNARRREEEEGETDMGGRKHRRQHNR